MRGGGGSGVSAPSPALVSCGLLRKKPHPASQSCPQCPALLIVYLLQSTRQELEFNYSAM